MYVPCRSHSLHISIPGRLQWWMSTLKILRVFHTITRWIMPLLHMPKACATAFQRCATYITIETHCTSITVQTVYLYTLWHERLVGASAGVRVARQRDDCRCGRGRRFHEGRIVNVSGLGGVAKPTGRRNVAQQAAHQENAAGLVQAVVLKTASIGVDA